MATVAFAWELGANFGHLERAMAIAHHLREQGDDVHFVVSNTHAAEKLLSPARFPYLACPLPRGQPLRRRATISYSDILAENGFHDALTLRALVRAWLQLWRLLRPDVVVIDHAPTALLSTHIGGIPAILCGTGFSIPPDVDPLPPFNARSEVPLSELRQADARVLAVVNEVFRAFGHSPIANIASLFRQRLTQVTSFPELDPYSIRKASYIGPVNLSKRYPRIEWVGGGKRIFAYFQPSVVGLEGILGGLRDTDLQTICVVPGAPKPMVERLSRPNMTLSAQPLDIETLLSSADAVVSYGSAGLVSSALQAGTPLLSIPTVVEQLMNAVRAAELGAGMLFTGQRTSSNVSRTLNELLSRQQYKTAARKFADKYASFDQQRAAKDAARMIAATAGHA